MIGISTEAFHDEFVKIASLKEKLMAAGKKLKLLETPAEAGMRVVRKTQKEFKGPSEAAKKQLHQMKLQRQLVELKKARGLA